MRQGLMTMCHEAGNGGSHWPKLCAPALHSTVKLSAAESELAELQSRIAPLEKEINQFTRQFRATKEQVVAQKHDLSASRYRQIEQEEVFYEQPAVTLERLRRLEKVMGDQVADLLSSLR